MSAELEKILKELLAEQKDTSLYTMTLERDRLLGALIESGLAVGVSSVSEFTLAPGATQTVVQLVPPGFIYIMVGEATFYTSLPWWVSYSVWMDQTAPALPIITGTRMPEKIAVTFQGIFPLRGFFVYTMTNLHVANTAYAMVMNLYVRVSNETWVMIREVYLDALVERLRKKALEISGIER